MTSKLNLSRSLVLSIIFRLIFSIIKKKNEKKNLDLVGVNQDVKNYQNIPHGSRIMAIFIFSHFCLCQ